VNNKYNVKISGNAFGGKSREEAVAALARYAGIGQERAEAMFARAPAIVKRDVPRDLALSYQKKLRDLGIDAIVAPATAEAATEAAASGKPAATSEPVESAAMASAQKQAASGARETATAGAAADAAARTQSAAPQQAAPAGAGQPPLGGGSGADKPAGKRHVGFVFTGEGYEYFKIWIVNILLTIVTLGIYAPWAKVRNAQYFYGNTSLDGASFAFTADPVKMLIGRLIAVGLLIVFMLLQNFYPLVAVALSLSFVFIFPWVINRTFAFYARNSTYRNIRFRFVGKYGNALITYIGWPLLAGLSLGLLIPFSLYKQKQYVVENHRYGNQSFSFRAKVGDFYGLCLIAFAVTVLGVIAGGLLAYLTPIPSTVGVLLGYGLGVLYFVTNINNVVFNNLSLSSHDFKAKYEMKGFGWLMVSNLLFTVLTLGLFIPWAKVRLARYAAEHIAVDVAQDLDKFAAISQPDESAFGEEFGDVFDMEVGF